MQLLLDSSGKILFADAKIIFDVFENEQKWAIMDAEDHVRMYALDDGFEVVDYEKELPKDIDIPSKYIYDNGEIVQNPEWHQTESEEDVLRKRVSNLEATLDDILTNVLPALMGEI
jgi:hypothetical protein